MIFQKQSSREVLCVCACVHACVCLCLCVHVCACARMCVCVWYSEGFGRGCLCQDLFFNIVADCRITAFNFNEGGYWHRCFTVGFVKVLRGTSRQLPLKNCLFLAFISSDRKYFASISPF